MPKIHKGSFIGFQAQIAKVSFCSSLLDSFDVLCHKQKLKKGF